MAVKTWGGIYLPEQKGPFIESSIAALKDLVARVFELGLGDVRLTWAKKVRMSSGHNAKRSLWIEGGAIILFYRWGFLGRHSTKRLVQDFELPDLLEFYLFGLGDIEKIRNQVEIVAALRELMVLPQVKRLERPVRIWEQSGNGYFHHLDLTTDGLEYYSSVASPKTTHFPKPETVTLDFVQSQYFLTLNDVGKARTKIHVPAQPTPTTNTEIDLQASPEEAPYLP